MKTRIRLMEELLELQQFKYKRLINIATIEGNKRAARLMKKKFSEL